jgi:hypothetical protein
MSKSNLETDLDSFSKIRDALRPLNEQGEMDSAMPRDLWIVVNGVEYLIEISRSAARINAAPPTASIQ